jgi:FtsP/CotA-like multicopper oxidase with cupredoxin domain
VAKDLTRRQFIGYGSAAALGLYLASRTRFLNTDGAMAAASPQVPLAGSAIPQFVDPVPNLLDAEHLIVDAGSQIILEMKEHLVKMLPAAAVPGYAGTYVWSYLLPDQVARPSHIGPVILATRGQPTEMKFVNKLGDTLNTNLLAYKYSTDQTLHWADPLNGEANHLSHMAMAPTFGSEGSLNYGQDPTTKEFTAAPIPGVVHLHGGEVPPVLDGGPDAWYTSDGSHIGHAFYSRDGNTSKNYSIYRYPNSQEGALIWFHDHTLGATRLNVYCGLAGAYLITDPSNDPANLPTLFPLVIQDRMFDANGQLFFPADSGGGVLWTTNPEHPYWVPEFVGDTIVVNGKAWPFMSVERKRYTFMFINGSNARTYEMSLVDRVSKNPGPPLWVIGTDGGYLDTPVKIDPRAAKPNPTVLPMMSGERYWVIVDFKGYEAGKIGPNGLPYSGNWLLMNGAKTPYPAGAAPQGSTVGRIMEFRVTGGPVTDKSYNPATDGALRTPMVRLTGANVQKTRQLTLNEVMGMPKTVQDPVTGAPNTAYPGGPLEILVNNTKWGGERITGVDASTGMYTMESIPGFTEKTVNGVTTCYSELPKEGETEVWEIVNLTADAHPIHLHLVQFQLLSRQNYNVNTYTAAYNAAFPAGYDYVMKTQTAGAVFVPAYGPPLPYDGSDARSGGKLGGNPDVAAKAKNGKPIYLQGPVNPPQAHENGWKDTVIVLPAQVTRILVRWAPTDIAAKTAPANASFPFDPNGGHGYVWHCHIVDHEDNEMMRPTSVTPNAVTRSYVKGTDY